MKPSSAVGIIFANSNDNALKPLTRFRSVSSVPFGGRYRLADFALSSFVNSGINDIGIIVRENYGSLMDHIGSGKYWDLDRKSGGIRMLPPSNVRGLRKYDGYAEALRGAVDFIEKCNAKQVVLFDGCVVGNIDFNKAMEYHIEKNADVTVLYKTPEENGGNTGTVAFEYDGDGRIVSSRFSETAEGSVACLFGVLILKKEVLLSLISDGCENSAASIENYVVSNRLGGLNVYSFRHDGYVAVMNSKQAYYNANMSLLNRQVRNALFDAERPVYTKTRDDMPTRYGIHSSVSNSFIADGCVIEGTVKNSVLFRGVKIGKNAVVENCILTQGTSVGEDTRLCGVIADKNAVIGDKKVIIDTDGKHIFIEKNETV